MTLELGIQSQHERDYPVQGLASLHAHTGSRERIDQSEVPNTGSLHFVQPLVDLRGVLNSIDLKLNLTYSARNLGMFGLPPSWGLDLLYVFPGVSLTSKGRTFVLDFDWADASDCHFGLRYINDHGMEFKQVSPALPLPSGLSGSY